MRARDAVITHPGTVPPLRRRLRRADPVGVDGVRVAHRPRRDAAAVGPGPVHGVGEAYHRWDVHPDLLIGIAVISTALCLVLVGWASLQRRRFTGVERRHRLDDVEPSVVARNVGSHPRSPPRCAPVGSSRCRWTTTGTRSRRGARPRRRRGSCRCSGSCRRSRLPRRASVPARPDGTDNAVPTGVVPGPRSRNRSVRDPAARPRAGAHHAQRAQVGVDHDDVGAPPGLERPDVAAAEHGGRGRRGGRARRRPARRRSATVARTTSSRCAVPPAIAPPSAEPGDAAAHVRRRPSRARRRRRASRRPPSRR